MFEKGLGDGGTFSACARLEFGYWHSNEAEMGDGRGCWCAIGLVRVPADELDPTSEDAEGISSQRFEVPYGEENWFWASLKVI